MAEDGRPEPDKTAPHNAGGFVANTVREVAGPARAGISSTAQIIVAAIGAVGTVCGAMIAAHKFDSGPTPAATPSPSVTFPSYTPTPGPTMAVDPNPPQIAGSWVGPDGTTVIQIQQAGANLDIGTTYTRPDGQQGQLGGRGMVQGQQLGWSYQTTDGDSGACGAALSADLMHLQGQCRHAQGPDFTIQLTRQS